MKHRELAPKMAADLISQLRDSLNRNTCLHEAALHWPENDALFAWLLANGCDPKATNAQGVSVERLLERLGYAKLAAIVSRSTAHQRAFNFLNRQRPRGSVETRTVGRRVLKM